MGSLSISDMLQCLVPNFILQQPLRCICCCKDGDFPLCGIYVVHNVVRPDRLSPRQFRAQTCSASTQMTMSKPETEGKHSQYMNNAKMSPIAPWPPASFQIWLRKNKLSILNVVFAMSGRILIALRMGFTNSDRVPGSVSRGGVTLPPFPMLSKNFGENHRKTLERPCRRNNKELGRRSRRQSDCCESHQMRLGDDVQRQDCNSDYPHDQRSRRYCWWITAD